MQYCQLQLTCASDEEADKIASSLLDKKLVACVKKLPVKSAFLWRGKKEFSDEVLILMDTIQENFTAIEKYVANNHSYETFVLISSPVLSISKDAQKWLDNELGKSKK